MKHIRLRDLENISSKNPDILKILDEAYGVKNKGILSYFSMRKGLKLIKKDIDELLKVDISKVAFIECEIKKPKHIETIPYVAMLHLQTLLQKKSEDTVLSVLISEIISTVCFNSNNKGRS